MAADSVRDSSVDGHSLDSLSCYSSTLLDDYSSTLIGEPAANGLANAEKEWYRELPVTELVEVSLRNLDRKNTGHFLVLVLRDLSVCCLGPEDDSLGDSLSFTLSSGGKMSWYPSSQLPQLDKLATTLVKLSFSHQPRDLLELLQIRQCVWSSLDKKLHTGSDLVHLVTFLLFARTFCDWDKAAAHLDWDSIVQAATPIAEMASDDMTSPTGKRRSLALGPTQTELKIAKRVRAALFPEIDSVKGAMAGTCLEKQLGDRVRSELLSRVRDSARTSAILSATLAAQSAAQDAAQKLRTDVQYDVAWESSLDTGGLEDENIVGRAGASYIADQLSERGLPRSDHAEAVRALSQGTPQSGQSGWTTGCSAGWIVGWRAGRRAARLFDWKTFEDDFPFTEWSGDQDSGWDKAWDRASVSDRTVTGPHVSPEHTGRSEYNAAWDAGWNVGWNDGYEAGWESGKEGARRAAMKMWRIARVAVDDSGFKAFWNALGEWCEGTPMKRVLVHPLGSRCAIEEVQRRVDKGDLAAQAKWNEVLRITWNIYWGDGTTELNSACTVVAKTIAKLIGDSAYTPILFLNQRNNLSCSAIGKRAYTHHELQAYVMRLMNVHFGQGFESKSKGQDLNLAEFVNMIWMDYSLSYIHH